MSVWMIVGIIALVLGLVVGNLLLLRDSSKFPIPKGFDKNQPNPKPAWDDDDDWPKRPAKKSDQSDDQTP
ncbi:DUF2897 family protein [Aestuariibacter halophilus]|uniref:DUF2897 family protein n=1 Tax=Fluctibacter halophilus TaxID=226011 RepID=A0ABS8G5X3_9ALTE|nr:DUF2897 family protein [Aestuariibacter halophilus]MCC2615997.1 DUF2897 family protein [Aestuariibacter halophilus]